MAERPIFVPNLRGSRLVSEIPVQFAWSSGMAPSQKKKNILALHESAAQRGISPILEISSKSEIEAGRRLSAFHLKTRVYGKETTVECLFQGSKVFELGGPFEDLYYSDSRSARGDERLKKSGKLIGFSLEGTRYPLVPATAFYDWIYINALYPHREWLKRLGDCKGFTDIEFNPERSLNCQARSFAIFISLGARELLDDSVESFDVFKSALEAGHI
jgi:hypothetical protein